jgi:hypothetical protein
MANNLNYGTLSLADTLATVDAENIYEYGEDRLFAYVDSILTAHNAIVADMMGTFVEFTNDRIRRWGNDNQLEMVDADEFGSADAQKMGVTGQDIGFPLRAYQAAVQWTRLYFEERTIREFAAVFDGILTGDILGLERSVKNALFKPTNQLTYVDRRTDSITLPLRALANADGAYIPRDKFGNAFDASTHTHYMGRAGGSFVAGDVSALVENVIEHNLGGNLLIYINRNDADLYAAFANFTEFQRPLLIPAPGGTSDLARGVADPYEVDNRPIGIWDGFATVWTKPWVPANYSVAFLTGGAEDVLAFRTRSGAGRGDLRMVARDEHYPLRAELLQREFGISVFNRIGAAILYHGGTSYVMPTIT